MTFIIENSLVLFCITFGVMQLTSLIMKRQEANFCTNDGTVRAFSIFDLEFAANAKEIVNLISGIFNLPPAKQHTSVKALKSQLYIDFLFMPAAYGSIFLLCIKTSDKLTTHAGKTVFLVLAWMQVLAWLCDIIENIYLLTKISPKPKGSGPFAFALYQLNEWFKWGISLTGAVCGISAMLYFWLTGSYSKDSLLYLIIVIAEILVIGIAGKMLSKKAKQ